MKIKLRDFVVSRAALSRLLSAHAPTAAGTYKLAKLKRAVDAHTGGESDYQIAYTAAVRRHGLPQPDGTFRFQTAIDIQNFEEEIAPLLAEDVNIEFTPLKLDMLDTLKVAEEKQLSLSAEELDQLSWAIDPADPV